MTDIELLAAALFLLVAVLYSSVGHAGASGYLAVMALLGFAPEQLKPTALALNLLVGGIGLLRFWHAGCVRWRNVVPFVLTSIPIAFVSQQIHLPKQSYAWLLAFVLVVAAIGVFRTASHADRDDADSVGRKVPWTAALIAGAAIGALAGLTGTGGAIFLTPLLLFKRWMPTREASGTSVVFVWVNSLSGLAGLMHAGHTLPSSLPIWLVAVAFGALLGTQLGLKWLPVRGLRHALGVVLLIAAGKLLLS